MRNGINHLSNIKLLPLTLVLMCAQILVANENSEISDSFCKELAVAKIGVKRCILQPDTSKLVRCSNFMQKKAVKSTTETEREKYTHLANVYDKRALEAWDVGTNIRLSKRTPDSRSQICGYYLNCLKKYVEDLPVFASNRRDARVNQVKIRDEYGK